MSVWLTDVFKRETQYLLERPKLAFTLHLFPSFGQLPVREGKEFSSPPLRGAAVTTAWKTDTLPLMLWGKIIHGVKLTGFMNLHIGWIWLTVSMWRIIRRPAGLVHSVDTHFIQPVNCAWVSAATKATNRLPRTKCCKKPSLWNSLTFFPSYTKVVSIAYKSNWKMADLLFNLLPYHHCKSIQ